MRMQGKRPTRAQKKFIGSKNLSPENWLVCKDLPGCMIVKSKIKENHYRTLKKGV